MPNERVAFWGLLAALSGGAGLLGWAGRRAPDPADCPGRDPEADARRAAELRERLAAAEARAQRAREAWRDRELRQPAHLPGVVVGSRPPADEADPAAAVARRTRALIEACGAPARVVGTDCDAGSCAAVVAGSRDWPDAVTGCPAWADWSAAYGAEVLSLRARERCGDEAGWLWGPVPPRPGADCEDSGCPEPSAEALLAWTDALRDRADAAVRRLAAEGSCDGGR